MAKHISSKTEWDKLLSDNAVVVADFYADWCGPCKMIAPIFESLAQQHTSAGRLAFAKIDTGGSHGLGARYSVHALPTFKLVQRGGTVVGTLQGARPAELKEFVQRAVQLASSGAGGTRGGSFGGPGHKLGGVPLSGGSSAGAGAATRTGSASVGAGTGSWLPGNLMQHAYAFVGLYFVSLFSFDPYKAAEASAFNRFRREEVRTAPAGQRAGASARPGGPEKGPRIQTLADL